MAHEWDYCQNYTDGHIKGSAPGQKETIRRLKKSLSPEEIAKLLGMSVQAIRNIIGSDGDDASTM